MAKLLTTAFSAAFIGAVTAWLTQSARTRRKLVESEGRVREALSAESERRASAEAHAARIAAMEAALSERDTALFELKAAYAALEARYHAQRRAGEQQLASDELVRSKLEGIARSGRAPELHAANEIAEASQRTSTI